MHMSGNIVAKIAWIMNATSTCDHALDRIRSKLRRQVWTVELPPKPDHEKKKKKDCRDLRVMKRGARET